MMAEISAFGRWERVEHACWSCHGYVLNSDPEGGPPISVCLGAGCGMVMARHCLPAGPRVQKAFHIAISFRHIDKAVEVQKFRAALLSARQ